MGNTSLVIVALLASCILYVSIFAQDLTFVQDRGPTEIRAGA